MNALFKTVNTAYAYIHAELGSDLFGDGTINKPYASHAKAATKSSNKILRGVLIENNCSNVVGDEMYQVIAGTGSNTLQNMKVQAAIGNLTNCILENNPPADAHLSGCILRSSRAPYGQMKATTISIEPTVSASYRNRSDSICYTRCTITQNLEGLPMRYFVFPSTCQFYYGTALLNVNSLFGNDPVENIRTVKRAIDANWSEFGANTALDNIFGTVNVNGQKIETCQIVKEQKDGGTLPDIFVSYLSDGITPKDFHLNPNPNNVALYASESGGYVGALPAANQAQVNNQYVNVNPATGVASAQAGNIFLYDAQSDLLTNNSPSSYAGQTWNRYTSETIEADKASSFKGVCNPGFASAQTSGLYVGKRQNLFGPVINPVGNLFALEPDKMYKVFDTSDNLLTESGIVVSEAGKSDINVFRKDTFITPETIVATCTARNANVTLREVINTPFESLEVLPYDNLTTPSQFPPFSSPVNSDVWLLYHKTGANAGKPVLFGEIAHDKIAYYNTYAITNADREYYTLATDTANYEGRSIYLRYCRVETNVIYDESLAV